MADTTESGPKRQLIGDGALVVLTFASLLATAGSYIALGGPVEWSTSELPYVRLGALVSTIAFAGTSLELLRRAR
jgi:hypothetical protein